MKKYILALLLALPVWASQSRAQEVYNIVLEKTTSIVNDPTSSYVRTKIAQFERTALVYLKSKSFEASDTVSADFLNTQAYYLSEFVTLYMKEVLMMSRKKGNENARREKISLFMSASECNPLFNDPDKETTLSFVTAEGEYMPFSLDTDWQKAYCAAKSRL